MQTAKDKVLALINFNIDAYSENLEKNISEPNNIKASSSIFILKELKSNINREMQKDIPEVHEDAFLNWCHHCANELVEKYIGLSLSIWQVSQPEQKFMMEGQNKILLDFIQELPKIARSL